MTARSPTPDTIMAHAFLRALLAWCARQTRSGPVAIPTGAVDPVELRQVLVALVCAQGQRGRS